MDMIGSSSLKGNTVQDKVSGKMHLFSDHQDDFSRSIDSVPEVMKCVHDNFALMYDATRCKCLPSSGVIGIQCSLLQLGVR